MLINPVLIRLPRHQLETALECLYASLETAKKIEQKAGAAYARRSMPKQQHDLEDAVLGRRGIENVILTVQDVLVQKDREEAK